MEIMFCRGRKGENNQIMAIIEEQRDNYFQLNWLDKYMTGHKGFICGGCFKNIFNKEKIKDLDIFFKNNEDWENAVEYFDRNSVGYSGSDKGNEDYRFLYENDNVKAYTDVKTGTRLELCRKIFGNAREIISQFDFTITKFAYYKAIVEDESGEEIENETQEKTHIEYRVLIDDKFFEHLHTKRLVTDDKILYPMSTFERMIRYAKYGYFPCRETKMKIIKAIRDLNEKQVELSENLYDGMD